MSTANAPVMRRLPSGRLVLDTGRVKIGLRAAAPLRDQGSQADAVQCALLGRRAAPSHILGAAGAMSEVLDRLSDRLQDRATLEARAAYDRFFARLGNS